MSSQQYHIAIVGSVSTDPGVMPAHQDLADYVKASLAPKEVTVSVCCLDDVGYVIDNEQMQLLDLRNNRDLKDYDLVFFRGKLAANINIASTVALYLDMHKVPHVNTAYAKRRPIGKIPQMVQLATMGLPLPKTVSASHAYAADLIDKHLQYPLIFKDVKGAHGDNNFLVKTRAELEKIVADYPNVEFMAQEFIPNDGDYRVLLVGTQTAIIHRQSAGDSHLNNTSAGGQATLVPTNEFSADILEQSRQFAKACDYEVAGVDAIIDRNTGKHYFLEINSQPQIVSGAFTEHKQQMIGTYFSELLDQSA